jgi:CBS domain-containing protein
MDEISAFLAADEPWNTLSPARLATLARSFQIEYFPRGRVIVQAGGEAVSFLYLLRSGAVEVRRPSEAGQSPLLIDRLGEGESFGFTSLLGGDTPIFDYVATEDTLAYLLPREAFLPLMEEPAFERFFVATLRDRLLHALRAERPSGERQLLSAQIGALVSRPPVTCSPDTSATAVARLMRDEGVSAVLVAGQPYGIVTDRDLRNKVLAVGCCFDTPVREIMSVPAIGLSAESLVFEALLLMVERNIHHLLVIRGDEPVGVLTNTDLLRRQSRSPVLLPRQLERARTLDDYMAYAGQVAATVESLVDAEVHVSAIGRVVALAHDALLQRIVADAERRLGPPPAPYAFLALGSQGRLEQTLRTDQDNALVYGDDAPADAEEYFAALASHVVDTLAACGFPRCSGDVMATNPRWRQPVRVWREYFSGWINRPSEEALLRVSIFFDYRRVAGTLDVDEALGSLVRRAHNQRTFLGRLAKAALQHTPPLGFFRRFLLERDGEHKHELDLKLRGTALVVDLARLFALEAGSPDVNTVARLHAAGAGSSLGPAQAEELIAAYEFLSTLRLRRQVAQMRQGQPLSNFINPAQLSDLERRQLKDAFDVVTSAQQGVEVTFQIALMA